MTSHFAEWDPKNIPQSNHSIDKVSAEEAFNAKMDIIDIYLVKFLFLKKEIKQFSFTKIKQWALAIGMILGLLQSLLNLMQRLALTPVGFGWDQFWIKDKAWALLQNHACPHFLGIAHLLFMYCKHFYLFNLFQVWHN